MSENYQYFTVPFESVPATPTYRAWYAIQSTDRSGVTWSADRPDISWGMIPTWVVGATDGDAPPAPATVIGDSTKCIPPPPLSISPSTASVTDLQQVLAVWLEQAPEARSA